MPPAAPHAPAAVAPRHRPWLVAGIMSGTSADGIDVALVRIAGRGWSRRVVPVAFYSLPYTAAERARILGACNASSAPVAEIARLNFWLGYKFADAVVVACRRASVPLASLDLVGSHGQTIYHQGDPGRYLGRALACTLQIGEPACIAEVTGVPVIADFRVADMAAGGKAAPLVPYLDYLLLGSRSRNRVALNIGGIANITAIPAGAGVEDVVAFDTGPGNMVMDQLVERLTRGRARFDAGGRMAAAGRALPSVLADLLRDPFYRRRPPKTAGREQYGPEFVERLVRRCGDASPSDIVATATTLTAETIARGLRAILHLPRQSQTRRSDSRRPQKAVWQVVTSGGGLHNRTLMRMLADRAPGFSFVASDDLGIPSDAKEAIAFAVLAHAARHSEPANLLKATGARHPALLGKLCLPPPSPRPR
jgi:anhydro-N-acetylmuramic acid kinase